jgi:hypothetical protein
MSVVRAAAMAEANGDGAPVLTTPYPSLDAARP